MEFKNIVFSGGGIRGLSYIGVLKALNDLKKMKNIERIIGTSIGSIFGLFCILKSTNEELDEYYNLFNERIIKHKDNFITESINLYKNFGLHNNNNIYNLINDIIYDKLNIDNITFLELHNFNKIEFTITGTCLSTRKIEYFNYKNTPNMEISKAIQISTSLPFYYMLNDWDDKKWIDGGICNNFPIEYFDFYDGKFNNNTLGFFLKSDNEVKYKINSFNDIIKGIENIELSQYNLNKNRNIVIINSKNISSIDFDISNEIKTQLINNGYTKTIDFFNEIENNKIKKEIDYIDYIKSIIK